MASTGDSGARLVMRNGSGTISAMALCLLGAGVVAFTLWARDSEGFANRMLRDRNRFRSGPGMTPLDTERERGRVRSALIGIGLFGLVIVVVGVWAVYLALR